MAPQKTRLLLTLGKAKGVETMPQFKIAVTRTAWGSADIEVDASSQAEAERKALNMAGNVVFSSTSSEYALTHGSQAPKPSQKEGVEPTLRSVAEQLEADGHYELSKFVWRYEIDQGVDRMVQLKKKKDALAPDAFVALPSKELVIEAFSPDSEDLSYLGLPRWATLTCGPDFIRSVTNTAAACLSAGPYVERITLTVIDEPALRPTWDRDYGGGAPNTLLCVTKDEFWFEQYFGEHAHTILTVSMSIAQLTENILDNSKPRIFHGNHGKTIQKEFEDNEEINGSNQPAETPLGN